MAIGKFSKKASDHIPLMKDQGLDYIVGTTGDNKVMISGSATLAAGAASIVLPEMADAAYQVILTTDGAVAAWSAKTTLGFDIAGTGTDEVDYLVVGKLASQA